jgi:Family of unknown function (DUF6069)
MTTTTGPVLDQASPITETGPTTAPRVRRRQRAKGVGVAVAASGVLYLGARAVGTDFVLTDPGATASHQLILPEIIVFALVFALLCWGTLALLERVTRHAKIIWSVLAGAVLAASFIPVFLEQATVDTRVMLCLIHVAVAVALLPMLRHGRAR